jgi:DNA-3-methyladenine glycosylase I
MDSVTQLQLSDRCPWCGQDPLYVRYHDEEWGVPEYQDDRLFEFLILEGMQAGLSWITVLKKREHYRSRMFGFDPEPLARLTDRQINEFMQDAGLIRNRLKLESIRSNAQAVLLLGEKGLSLSSLLWKFTDGIPLINHWQSSSQVPAETTASVQMSRELKRLGFRFVGSTICYALMQATGMVNDHLMSCHRHRELAQATPKSARLPRHD